MHAAFGQNVDPNIFESERLAVQVKLQIFSEGGNMFVQ